MSAITEIAWTDRTWNVVRGCSRVSLGCGGPGRVGGCYAERQAHRFNYPGGPYQGLTRMTPNGPRWTGVVRLIPEVLDEPLRWRKPQKVFVNSMSDLFHESLGLDDIAAVFGVMAAAPQHVFQILTKRPQRMREWFSYAGDTYSGVPADGLVYDLVSEADERIIMAKGKRRPTFDKRVMGPWPLPTVWLGVSVEDQATADERIPLLLQTPAAKRFVSYEPALGPVDFRPWLDGHEDHGTPFDGAPHVGGCVAYTPPLDWVIVGGESGPGARPFDLGWARFTVAQCKAAGVAAFVKQLGARPVVMRGGRYVGELDLRDRKGGDPGEWGSGDWPREFPA